MDAIKKASKQFARMHTPKLQGSMQANHKNACIFDSTKISKQKARKQSSKEKCKQEKCNNAGN